MHTEKIRTSASLCDDPRWCSYTEKYSVQPAILAEPSYTEQVIRSRVFLLFQVGFTGQNIFSVPGRVNMWSRTFLLLRRSYQEVFCEKTSSPSTLLKETLVQVFSCEFLEILRAFSHRTPLVASSDYSEQVIPSRTFLLSVKVRYGVEHFFYAILSRLY